MTKNPTFVRLRVRRLFHQPWQLAFLFVFALVSTIVLYGSLASGIPVVRGNADYWRPRIARCESGGNYHASNSAGYYGAYQFDAQTWSNYQGYDRADQAPPAVQDAKFIEVFNRRGSQPWNSSYFCWSNGAPIATPPPPPLFVPKLSSYNVTISGQVLLNGAPLPNVHIFTCGNTDPGFATDSGGNYNFPIASGTGFCIRIVDGIPPGAVLSGINNNIDHQGASSYEYQVAGQDNYHSVWAIFSPTYSWDRSVDAAYDFHYQTP